MTKAIITTLTAKALMLLALASGATSAPAALQIEPTGAKTELLNGRLTVTDDKTNLKGFSITAKSANSEARQDLAEVKIEIVDTSAVPARPENMEPISDFFLIRRAYAHPVEIRFPLGNLPPETDVRDVNLYSFGEALDVEGEFWGTSRVDVDFEMSGDEIVIIISLEGLISGLYVLGIAKRFAGE